MSHILRISDATTLALHAMILLASAHGTTPPTSLSLKYISAQLHSSPHHLSKVLQRLVKAGVISSTKGPHGGFRLILEPETLRLLDIYEIMEGRFAPSTCLFGGMQCQVTSCSMGRLLSDINQRVYDYLSSTYLEQFSSNI